MEDLWRSSLVAVKGLERGFLKKFTFPRVTAGQPICGLSAKIQIDLVTTATGRVRLDRLHPFVLDDHPNLQRVEKLRSEFSIELL